MQRRPQRIEPSDLTRMRDALDVVAATAIQGVRLRAIVMLAHASALDLSELLALDLRSALELNAPRRWTVVRTGHLAFVRGKKNGPPPYMPAAAAPYVEAWIKAAARAHGIQWPPPPGIPLFHSPERGKLVALSPRTVQSNFQALQRSAKTAAHYRFSDLRHDAITLFALRVRYVQPIAQFARISERSALAYLPATSARTLAEIDASDA